MSNSFSTSARGRNNFLPLVLAAAVLLGLLAPGRAQLPGTVNPAFAPTVRTNGNIAFIATQADGKQLIGGNFSRVGAVLEPSLARLNIDGSLDTSFASPTGLGSVDYIAVGADGKIFVLYEGASNFNANFTLVSLNTDGSQDDAFVPPTFSGAHASNELYPFVVAVQSDDKVLVGGGFAYDPDSSETVHTVTRYNADGSEDGEFQFPTTLNCQRIDSLLLLSDDQLLVSGAFYSFNAGYYTAQSLLRLNADGTQDTTYPVGSGQNAGYDLTLQSDGKLLFITNYDNGGYPGGTPGRLNVDGSVDTTFTQPFDTTSTGFTSLVLQPDGKILLGGRTAIIYPPDGGNEIVQSGVARINADGTTDATFNPMTPLVDNLVTSVALQPNGQILVGGNFLEFAGVERSSLGRLNADGSLDATYSNEITNVGVGYGVALLPGGQPVFADSGVLVNGSVASNLFSFNADGSLNTVFAASLSASQAFDNGDGIVSTNAVLAVQADGKVLLAGVFNPFYGYYVPTANRYNADGSLDSTFSFPQDTYGALNAVVPQADGHIYVAGQISEGYDRYTDPLDRLNADGTIDNTFSPPTDPAANGYRSSTIYALAVQSDGKVVAAGEFLAPYGSAQPPTVQRFNTDGSVDTTFNAGMFIDDTYAAGTAGLADKLALQPDGKIIVAGGFTSIGGATANYLARLNTDGSLDTTFNTGSGAMDVASIVVQANGEILIGGGFTTVEDEALNGVARLRANGSVDPLFFPGTGVDDTGVVNSLALAPDGSVFAAGTFSSFNGQPRDGVVQLIGGEVIPPVVTPGTGTAEVGMAFTYQIMAANNPTSFGATGLPDGLSVSTTTGLIGGTPITSGIFMVTLTATNAAGTGTATLSLTVNAPAPVVTPTVASAQVGQAYFYQITASNQPTSYGVTNLPPGLKLDAATGLISGTPTVAGMYTLTLSATNVSGTGTAILMFPVSSVVSVVTLTADIPQATAGSGGYGEFTVTRTGGNLNVDLTVSYAVKGSAVDGSDYVLLKGTRKIKAGKGSAKIKVQPLGNGGGTGVKHVVTLVLEPGSGYTVGTTGKVKVKLYGE